MLLHDSSLNQYINLKTDSMEELAKIKPEQRTLISFSKQKS